MPIYTYACKDCKFKEDQIRPINDMDKFYACPNESCKGTMKKVLILGRVIRNQNVPT